MLSVYLDNFRGFSKCLIPLSDVNFLVGENSTGKSSLIHLLSILYSPRFNFDFDFNSSNNNFNQFRDLVSVHSEDKSYFRVGYVYQRKENNQKKNSSGIISAVAITYKEVDGLPSLSQFALYENGKQIFIKKTEKSVLYKTSVSKPANSYSSFVKFGYKELINEQTNKKASYKNLKIDGEPVGPDTPMGFILLMVSDLGAKEFSMKISNQYIFEGRHVELAPIRTTPKRTYDEVSCDFSPEGEHTPYLIRKILTSRKEAKRFKSNIESIGKDSGLFQSINIKEYGKDINAPFEVEIILDGKSLSINSVGYGVSQSLPIIVELLNREHNSVFTIQQPEVHLHPKAQASIGELIHKLSIHENKKFYIETHSDYLIDRYRIEMRKNKRKPKSDILFFERKNNSNHVSVINIDENGAISSKQPKAYRGFFIKEEMKLLGL